MEMDKYDDINATYIIGVSRNEILLDGMQK